MMTRKIVHSARAQWNAERRAYLRRRLGLPDPTRPCPALCECCGQAPGKKGLCLDHCHSTGKFRGWLCSKCNMGIGLLGDTKQGIRAAMHYLRDAANPVKYGLSSPLDSPGVN